MLIAARSYDPASLAILDRINHVVSLLEASPFSHPYSSADHAESFPVQTPASHVSSLVAPAGFSGHEDGQNTELPGPVPVTDDDLFGSTNAAGHPANLVNLESILKWPIFSPYDGHIASTDSLVLEPTAKSNPASGSSVPNISHNRGIREDEFTPLSKRFLAQIHTKNPILDVKEYKKFIKEAAEQGPYWDGPSCLVVSLPPTVVKASSS
jgi:hypothetical protein